MTGKADTGWLRRLRERGVIRVAASYAVIAWLLLQIADVTFEPMGAPKWAMPSLIVAAVLGFPIAVALAWFYEAGDRGVALDTAAEGVARPVTHGLRRYADLLIIGALLVAVAVLLVRQSNLVGSGTANPAIAVLPFQNLSTAAEGEVLAMGIAESVLHQLANLAELDVISRTSSFTFGDRKVDAREIGQQLGARYLLEGSVQSDRTRMRVTTQLIDTQTGADVWSMRFDRPHGDVFEVQDEIAVQVTRALELSLDASAHDRLTGQGTQNLDAYLAFLQGRSLLANDRVVDMKDAIGHFERAIRADPGFADAYVNQAAAELFVAEYEVTDDRQERFERALRHGKELVGKALELDPENGDAYLQRAYLTAFDDLSAAEADYRRGLDLSPNSAPGYAGLAAVLYENPARRDEALELLDRARRIDPLEPAYDVKKAVFLFYERGDVAGASELLEEVLEHNPRYLPALVRLCEIRGLATGQDADGIRYCEQALAIDPLLEAARRMLITSYLDVDDPAAAQQLMDMSRGETAVPRTMIALYERDWLHAGEAAYEALARRTSAPTDQVMVLNAIRMHARTTRDSARALTAVEAIAGVSWDASGHPSLTGGSPYRDGAIALADLLILDGQEERGRRLLAEIIDRMNRELRGGGSERWYYGWHPVALALNGDAEAAMAMLERSNAAGARDAWWFRMEAEPAFEALHGNPRFEALRTNVRAHVVEQRRKLTRLRAEGLVPART
jgi:TolB-like protein